MKNLRKCRLQTGFPTIQFLYSLFFVGWLILGYDAHRFQYTTFIWYQNQQKFGNRKRLIDRCIGRLAYQLFSRFRHLGHDDRVGAVANFLCGLCGPAACDINYTPLVLLHVA